MNAFEKIIERFDKKRKYYGDNALSIFVTDGYTVAGVTNDAKEDAYADAIEIVKKVAEEYEKSEKPTNPDDYCEWRLCDDESNVYDTTCRNPFILMDGSPSDNRFEYCPYCGKRIKEVE